MNKKISLGLALSLIIVAATASFAITMTVSRRMYNTLITDLPNRIAQYEVVAEIDELMRTHYFDYDAIDQNTLTNSLAEGYLLGLNDRASFFMTAAEYNDYQNKLEGNLPGIGITHTPRAETGTMLVTQVASGSPSADEGLKKGDEIIKIEGTKVTNKDYDKLAAKLEGSRLTTLDITYRRDGKDKNINVMIGYQAQSVYYEATGNIGYMKITAFYQNTISQFNKAMESLKKQGVEKMIFDVRGTSEGSIDFAAQVIDAIVPVATQGTKAIATLKDKNGEIIKTYTSDANNITMDMAVLMDAKTSGGAELFAQDLQDFLSDNVILIGLATAGNGAKREPFRLKDGNAVMLKTAQVTPYTSETYDKKGVAPELIVSLAPGQEDNLEQLAREDDAQLNAAYANLSESNN